MGIFSKLFGEKAGIIDDIAEAKKRASNESRERGTSSVSAADTSVSTADNMNNRLIITVYLLFNMVLTANSSDNVQIIRLSHGKYLL